MAKKTYITQPKYVGLFEVTFNDARNTRIERFDFDQVPTPAEVRAAMRVVAARYEKPRLRLLGVFAEIWRVLVDDEFIFPPEAKKHEEIRSDDFDDDGKVIKFEA